MKRVIHRITLDLHKSMSNVQILCKRGDIGRYIHITLAEGGRPYEISPECTAVLRGKNGNDVIFNQCTISDGVIECPIVSSMLASPGIVKCEITLYGSDSNSEKLDIATSYFEIFCNDRVPSDSEIEGTDKFSALSKIMTSFEETLTDIEQKLADGVFNGPQGEKGDPGYTPKKGIDYYTETEKLELVSEVEKTIIGDIEASLDGIIAIQESLIGGDS